MAPNNFPYRPLIGSFNCLSCTMHADQAFSTNNLVSFMESYDQSHILLSRKQLRLYDHHHATIQIVI